MPTLTYAQYESLAKTLRAALYSLIDPPLINEESGVSYNKHLEHYFDPLTSPKDANIKVEFLEPGYTNDFERILAEHGVVHDEDARVTIGYSRVFNMADLPDNFNEQSLLVACQAFADEVLRIRLQNDTSTPIVAAEIAPTAAIPVITPTATPYTATGRFHPPIVDAVFFEEVAAIMHHPDEPAP